MAPHHISWNRSEDSFHAFAHRDSQKEPYTERPSLLDMSREQYQGLLQKVRRRTRRED